MGGQSSLEWNAFGRSFLFFAGKGQADYGRMGLIQEVAAGMLVALALAFALASALLHVAFYIALGLLVVGLLSLNRGGGHRMSLGDAGAPEESAHDAGELEREMRSIRDEGARGSVFGNRIARPSFGAAAWIGAGVAMLLICVFFG